MSTTISEREIDGHVFSVQQLPGRRADQMLRRLGRVVGPGLGAMAAAAKVDDPADMEAEPLARSLQGVLANLTDAEATAIQDGLLEGALVDNAPLLPQFNILFQGRVFLLYRVLAFAVEVNYRDFFDGAKSLIARFVGAAGPRAKPPSGSSSGG